MNNVIYGNQIYPENRIAKHLKDIQGIKHFSRREPLAPRPGEPITLTVATSSSHPFDEVICYYTVDNALHPSSFIPHPSSIILHPSAVHWDLPAWEYVRTWQGQIPGQSEGVVLRYRIAGHITGTHCWRYADNQTENSDEATDFAVYIGEPSAPEWSRHAILYHIFLDRFYPGDNRPWNRSETVSDFYGGTLRGVIDKLEYIYDLGFNTLWLSPVFASPTHHGYDATDLCTIEPRFGTNADLKELIEQAHARGIRILLDFVPNHWSNQHPTFLDAQAKPDSPYRHWYIWRNWPDEYEAFFDVKTMPKLNLRHGSPVRTHLLDTARFWLEQGVDGYRIDHADGPAHDFWADFRRTCQQTTPHCWLFGEVVKPPPVQRAFYGNLHGQLDFALALALRETFALGNWNLAQLDAFLAAHNSYFPSGFSRPAFLDNHDMNRFLFLAGDDTNRLKLAALVLFTLPGPPVLYYGTETGLSQHISIGDGQGFDEARLPMKWEREQDSSLIEYFRTLIHLRKTCPALIVESRRTLILDPNTGVYAYTPNPDTILIALNTSSEPRTITVPTSLPSTARDLLNGNPVYHHDGQLEIHLPPESGAFIC
jgi:cyclomaltodextrinase / maltogenic alpha-amylase / neopullulanase